MKASETIVAAVAGTTLMTLFSHLISGKEGKNFSEPKLLANLEKDLLPRTAKEMALPMGWTTHYAIGLLFTDLYLNVGGQTNGKPKLGSGLLYGAATGLAGILMWKTVFSLHPAPPKTHYTKFYKQLFWAHLIFGGTIALSEKAIRSLKK